MLSFSNKETLLKAIKEKISQVSKEEVTETIKNIESKHIENDVYKKYTPCGKNPYQRRYKDNGLADEDNIKVNVKSNENGDIKIISVNKTEGNGDTYGKSLIEIIETGEGYTWGHRPPARPFIEKTKEGLKENKQIENALKEGLKKSGLKIK